MPYLNPVVMAVMRDAFYTNRQSVARRLIPVYASFPALLSVAPQLSWHRQAHEGAYLSSVTSVSIFHFT
jgi:hypothetical protein